MGAGVEQFASEEVGGTSRKPRHTAPWRSTIAWLRSTPIPPLWKIAWLPIGGCSAMERDPAKIVIAGDSAGGNLTLVTLMSLRDAGDPLPAAAVWISTGD